MPVPASVRAAITPGQSAPPPTLFPSDRAVKLQSTDPTPRLAKWEAGSVGQLGWRRHELALRESPLWSDADRRVQPAVESDDGLRVRGAVAVRAESPAVQARALGQGHCARHVDQQGRPGDDLSAARDSAARRRRGASCSRRTTSCSSSGGADGGGGQAEFRIVPIDGRKHDERQTRVTTYMGYTVGSWDGDTLVLDSIAFNDFTWLARGGLLPLRRNARGRAVHASGQ